MLSSLEKLTQRFLSHVDKNSDGHWYWIGCVDKDGYGITNDSIRKLPAHVLSFKLFNGNHIKNLVVMHQCDIPRCVNPDHLKQGTQRDNIRDCVAKGRHHKARRTHCTKGHPLTSDNIYLRTRNGSTERRCKQCCKLNKA